MVVVGFPVVLLIISVLQAFTERIIGEFPPFPIVDIFTLSSVICWVQHKIHKLSCQDIVATQRGGLSSDVIRLRLGRARNVKLCVGLWQKANQIILI